MNLTEKEYKSKVYNEKGPNRYENKMTLIKLAQVKCPTPRNTRFPNLWFFNGEIISIEEVKSLLIDKDLNSILATKESEKKEIFKRKDQKIHEKNH